MQLKSTSTTTVFSLSLTKISVCKSVKLVVMKQKKQVSCSEAKYSLRDYHHLIFILYPLLQ